MTVFPLSLTKVSRRVPAPRSIVQEFHISRAVRDACGFDDSLFSTTGNVVFANFLAVRTFTATMNARRDLIRQPEQALVSGQVNTLGLIDEILHYVAALYKEEHGVDLWGRALDYIGARIGRKAADEVLLRFSHDFPNIEVYRGKQTEKQFLEGRTGGFSHREAIFEEVLLLGLANANPAFNPYGELFNDAGLRRDTQYEAFQTAAHEFFDVVPPFGPDRQNLLDMLRSPAIAVPHSLHGQLQYMQERWGLLLGQFLLRLLGAFDLMDEEWRFFRGRQPAGQGGYDSSLSFRGDEPERFSHDKDWMPRVILLAKSTLVWLDQLSKQYGRSITTLEAIPDEELDRLAASGFNALWLIGLWERSTASKDIKRRGGNPEAEASAYSLHDYDIAGELGGWNALEQLRERCRRRGIRLASDMVPNHTAMDSRWVSEHPDYFLQLDHCPYPGYRFDGPDLSRDGRIEIKLEDHYWDRSDAAVVFRYVDKGSGRHRYIYHGNDGTSMPWNDTAQLDYLNPETREAVIQVILHVARNFSIIRFDAAMTLAKKHIQRLWHPTPGAGGAIATRSEHALAQSDFDRAIPEEFWREVVDRVAREVPDTLLLAEAFWMMEGYFVRSLGMHRVYNSAFMHMFKNEDNEKYRQTIKNTLEFDPDILKRFVNFMNNPDEETAAVQFGTGDKYFGVATVLSTMPGTPMFGHGQVEGFREKYGMEFRRAYWNETPDTGMVERHEREIFPLLHRRYLFAEVRRFRLYDFWMGSGGVNQNVFAYSNGTGTEHALVIYNNSFERASGWIKDSAAYVEKLADGTRATQHQTLAQSLGLSDAADRFLAFHEQGSGLWYLRRSRDVHRSGLFCDLGGYGKQVFLDLHEVSGAAFGVLHDRLGGAGVHDLGEALLEATHAGLFDAVRSLIGDGALGHWSEVVEHPDPASPLWGELRGKVLWLHQEASRILGSGDPDAVTAQVLAELEALATLRRAWKDSEAEILTAWALLGHLGDLVPHGGAQATRGLWEDWGLERRLARQWAVRGVSWEEASRRGALVAVQGLLNGDLKTVLSQPEVQAVAGVNTFEGVVWISQEGVDALAWWLTNRLAVTKLLATGRTPANVKTILTPLVAQAKRWTETAAKTGYRLDAFLAALEPAPAPKRASKKTSG